MSNKRQSRPMPKDKLRGKLAYWRGKYERVRGVPSTENPWKGKAGYQVARNAWAHGWLEEDDRIRREENGDGAH